MSKLIIMVGLPSSGKSTLAKKLSIKENATIYASDDLRQELFNDVNECNRNKKLFTELHKRVKQDLSKNKNVIYDATNINYKKRMAFLSEIKKYNCRKVCYLMATPYEKCLDLNRDRGRVVPEHVIKRMYMNFFIPQFYEGWDDINIVWNTDGYKFDTHELFNGENGLNFINQDNPNHTLTIGKHCLRCSALCEEKTDDVAVIMAGLYHDIGKRFTKSNRDKHGNIGSICHYFQHHLVSAYDSLFYLHSGGWDDKDILEVTNYIQWHMQPFFIKQEKTRQKYIKLWGKEFYDNLMILHETDKEAKFDLRDFYGELGKIAFGGKK